MSQKMRMSTKKSGLRSTEGALRIRAFDLRATQGAKGKGGAGFVVDLDAKKELDKFKDRAKKTRMEEQ